MVNSWAAPASVAVTVAFAQLDPIVTDRPDFTESSVVVGVGIVQVENGITVEWDAGSRAITAPEILIRVGIARKWEVRVGLPNYNWFSHSAGGFDDLYIGAKYEIGECHGIASSLIPAVFMPVGATGIRSEECASEIKLTWAKSLPQDRALSGMLYASFPTETGTVQTRWQHTISLGMPVAENTGLFIEHVTDFGPNLTTAHFLHAGFTFQPNPDSQWDIHFGFGLNNAAPDAFLAAGYSFRCGPRGKT